MEPYGWAYFLFLIPIGALLAVWWRVRERMIDHWAIKITAKRMQTEIERELS
jgi:hypothetical protein